MGETVIEIEGVGKRYRLGEHTGDGADLRERIVQLSRRLRGRPRPEIHELWSLRDVSLSVERGEAVGVIGANGSGKSTLLKIVSNITTPTEGRCRTQGRVGSLLEVAAGFHGELTGIENTYLNGAILGMTRKEITRRLDEIVAFAELDGFMDTPVKRYSSGMYLRLGFAIAAHLEADILLVDEVLAVGDAEFQRRCLGKMSEVEQSGRTVMFISHDMQAMGRLCPRAIWLDHGRVRHAGPTASVIDAYIRSTAGGDAVRRFDRDVRKRAQATSVAVVDCQGVPLETFSSWTSAWIEIGLRVDDAAGGIDVGAQVATDRAVQLFGQTIVEAKKPPITKPGEYRVRVAVPKVLMPGSYVVDVWVGTAYEDIDWRERAIGFTIGATDRPANDRLLGLDLEWTVERT